MALSGIEKWMIDEGRYAHLYFKDYKLFIWQVAVPTLTSHHSLPLRQCL